MKIAIVGSRNYPDPVEVADFVLGLPEDTTVISGGAPGVDSWAANVAHFVAGLETDIKWADWCNLGKRAGFVRNQEIVDAADEVVLFWDGTSKGTADTCRRAVKSGKMWRLINGRGKVEEE